jgi:hypothetical protein
MNWAKSLCYEIQQEHGATLAQQFASCDSHFSRVRQARNFFSAAAFIPLFHCFTFAASVASLERFLVDRPWMFQSAIVQWFYAVENASKSMLGSWDSREPDTHRKIIDGFEEIRETLPHPFNMVANRVQGEQYSPLLPSYPSATIYGLDHSFRQDRASVQGMLLQYLKGTADFRTDQIKIRVKREGGFANFNSRDAREARDRALPARVNLLECAYRYRGKAHYRDALYLVYGADQGSIDSSFIPALSVVAKFSAICALALAKHRSNGQIVAEFLRQSNINFRDLGLANQDEKFWPQVILNPQQPLT